MSDDTNPKDRNADLKPSLHLVPAALLIFCAKVMQLGAAKYGPYNWRKKKVRLTVYISAALRHVYACLDGEWTDPESEAPHLGHAACCFGIVLDAYVTGTLIDDRPKPGKAAELIKEMTTQKPRDPLTALEEPAISYQRTEQYVPCREDRERMGETAKYRDAEEQRDKRASER